MNFDFLSRKPYDDEEIAGLQTNYPPLPPHQASRARGRAGKLNPNWLFHFEQSSLIRIWTGLVLFEHRNTYHLQLSAEKIDVCDKKLGEKYELSN